MNYHNIVHDDMRNGVGLRVTLFVSGCNNQCVDCQNPQTWDINSGIPVDESTIAEIADALSKPYIHGLTLSGGDPLHPNNIETCYNLCDFVKTNFPNKTIWLYTGYSFENIWIKKGDWTTSDVNLTKDYGNAILKYVDVLVDGKFVKELADVNYHWAGSTNQRIIDVQKTLQKQEIVLYEE